MRVDEYITVSTAKAKLLKILRNVEKRGDKVVITRNGMPKAILMNFEDYEGLIETLDILSDEETMKGIKAGIADVKAGRVIKIDRAFEEE